MVGLNKFKEAFEDFSDNYVIIGGTACDISKSTAAHKIVVTHHVPSFRMLCPKFKDSKANGAFTVELEEFIESSGIDYWIYGHSHYNVDVRIGNTQCISNQLGYVFHNEHLSFKPDAVIEV